MRVRANNTRWKATAASLTAYVIMSVWDSGKAERSERSGLVSASAWSSRG